MRYVRRASPLHVTRAGVGLLWCTAIAVAALAVESPVAVLALAAGVLAAAVGAGVWGEVRRALWWVAALALAFALINPFVVREGVTVIFRVGEVPPFGQVDLTLEALAWGVVFGVRLLVVSAAFALLTAAVDPDALLQAFRRVSLRSALAASLAVRLVPVLARDGRRLAEAQRCRPDAPTGTRARVGVLRAVTTSALDRAMDVAATLEVRGYAAGRRAPRRLRPWSRHDVAFAASTAAIAGLLAWSLLSGFAAWDAYPELDLGLGGEHAVLAVALAAVLLAPFADRRGIEP